MTRSIEARRRRTAKLRVYWKVYKQAIQRAARLHLEVAASELGLDLKEDEKRSLLYRWKLLRVKHEITLMEFMENEQRHRSRCGGDRTPAAT